MLICCQVCRAEEEREGAGRGEGMFSRRQVEEGDLPLSWVQVRDLTLIRYLLMNVNWFSLMLI